MKPILYEANTGSFDTNGLGAMGDAILCLVTQEKNRSFELELQYPVDGIHFDLISSRRILAAPAMPGGTLQPFRIYSMSRPMNGVVTVLARHVVYDLMGYPVSPFTVTSPAAALAAFQSYCPVTLPVTFSMAGEISGGEEMKVEEPTDIWKLMGTDSGCLLDLYGGDWEFDGFSARLHAARGQQRHVTIRYGKNLTALTHEESVEDTYSAVYPYYKTGSDLVTAPGLILYADPPADYTRILALSLNQEFAETPSASALAAKAREVMEREGYWKPRLSVKVEFELLRDTGELRAAAREELEHIELFDTVEIYHPGMGVSVSEQITKTVYNVLLDKYDSVECGEDVLDLAGMILR